MNLGQTLETLQVLGDESRLRLCVLLAGRELCVSDLVRVTGISQSRVSTHLGRLRDAGMVRDRRHGAQCFYSLAQDALSSSVKAVLDETADANDPTVIGDRSRLKELEAERRQGLPEFALDDLERDYSPGRTWQSLALAMAACLELGDVLDVGSGDGAAAATFAPYCRSLTCIDTNARLIEKTRERLAHLKHTRAQVADVHQLPFAEASFDRVLMLHTLTYAEDPPSALAECARVLRPAGRFVLLCLAAHQQREVTARFGERHAGFSPAALGSLIKRAGLLATSPQIICREARKPHLEVVLAIGQKPAAPCR